MAWLAPSRITPPVLLRVLGLGFGLVVVLLGAAGFEALRSTRLIESDAAQVGREQLAMVRLLNDVQAAQNTLASLLHQLAPNHQSLGRARLLADLDTANRALAKVSAEAAGTPEGLLWRDLDAAVKEFSRGVRAALQGSAQVPVAELGHLLELHDRVVQIEQRLLVASEQRLQAAERHIEVESQELAANSRLLLGACLLAALICAILTVFFARISIRRIEAQASELSRVSWHLMQSQETLARRFSHELHDELGQSLAAVRASVSAGGAAEWSARRADCIQLVDHAIANVRELSQLMHPVILDDFGLDAGLRWLAEGFSQRTGILAEYHSSFHDRLDDQTETHLFRIAQEALTNVARHSGATMVRIDLHRSGNLVQMVIEDNGRGLQESPSGPRPPSLGMIGMRARALESGGEFRLTTPPKAGVRLEVEVPLPATSLA